MVDIISLLSTDGYIMCNKTIIKMFGADCAILIGELCAEYNYYKARGELENNSFFSTQENIEANTGLNAYAQRKAIKLLVEANILVVEKKGLPAKYYYSIVTDSLIKLFTASPSNFEGLEVQNLNINNNKQKTINEVISKDITNSENFLINEPETKPKKKSSLYRKCLEMIDEFTNLPDLHSALVDYLEFRLEVKDKPLIGANQFKGLLRSLDKAVEQSHQEYIDIVLFSLSKGWLNFYPIPQNSGKSKCPDTNVALQQKANLDDMAKDENGDFKTY